MLFSCRIDLLGPLLAACCLGAVARGEFTTIVNTPQDTVPSPIQSDTQINVLAGSAIPGIGSRQYTDPLSNVEINLLGGVIGGQGVWTYEGVTANIQGGRIESTWHANRTNVTMTGGEIEAHASFNGGDIRLLGGRLTGDARTIANRIEIDGVTIEGLLDVSSGADLVVASGNVGYVDVVNDSTFRLTGGRVGGATLTTFGRVELMGGVLGHRLHMNGADLHVYGGDFLFNNAPITETMETGAVHEVTFGPGFEELLTGVLSDGTPFQLGSFQYSTMRNKTITLHSTPLPEIGPAEIDAAAIPAPFGLRAGQTLTVRNGQEVPDDFSSTAGSRVVVESGGVILERYEAMGTTIEVAGGRIFGGLDALYGSQVTVEAGGVIGAGMRLHEGSTLQIDGGVVHGGLRATKNSRVVVDGGDLYQGARLDEGELELHSGSIWRGLSVFDQKVTVTGGEVGPNAGIGRSRVAMSGGAWDDNLELYAGALFHLSGGSVDRRAEVFGDAVLSITGGSLGPEYLVLDKGLLSLAGGPLQAGSVRSGGVVELFGSGFLIDGEPIADLPYGVATEVTDRDVSLTAQLLDGTTSTIGLASGELSLQPEAVLRVTLLTPGDFNRDGLVDAADYTVWRDTRGVEVRPWAAADGNGDGLVNDLDYAVWREHFGLAFEAANLAGPSVEPIPEPNAVALLLFTVAMAHLRRFRFFFVDFSLSDSQTRRA